MRAHGTRTTYRGRKPLFDRGGLAQKTRENDETPKVGTDDRAEPPVARDLLHKQHRHAPLATPIKQQASQRQSAGHQHGEHVVRHDEARTSAPSIRRDFPLHPTHFLGKVDPRRVCEHALQHARRRKGGGALMCSSARSVCHTPRARRQHAGSTRAHAGGTQAARARTQVARAHLACASGKRVRHTGLNSHELRGTKR